MDTTRSSPVFIVNSVDELFVEQCSFDDKSGEWQELEQFWGEEKNRLQLVDGQLKPLSSSLEEHLLHDNFLNEPTEKEDQGHRIVRGEDLADIPTTYLVDGFRPQEFIVIGTYVDKEILPGFQYKVRKNLTEEYLFGGKAKYLENIGLGYGKRMTFESETLNENENYFWSDSRVHGYAFIFQTVSNDDIFHILDTKTGLMVGRVIINNPSLRNDEVLATMIGERGYVEKEVAVQFSCIAILSDTSNKQSLFVDDVTVRGKAVIVRENFSSKAKVNQIFLDDFILDSCLLVPEE